MNLIPYVSPSSWAPFDWVEIPMELAWIAVKISSTCVYLTSIWVSWSVEVHSILVKSVQLNFKLKFICDPKHQLGCLFIHSEDQLHVWSSDLEKFRSSDKLGKNTSRTVNRFLSSLILNPWFEVKSLQIKFIGS